MTIARAATVWLLLLAAGASAQASPIYADVLLGYSDSGAGPLPGPYGGTSPGGPGFPIPISPNVVLGAEPGPTGFQDFLSLPTGSSVTVGFSGRVVVNGPGNDILIPGTGAAFERANVLVSSDGANFTLLGVAIADGGVNGFDLSSIGFTSPVAAVRVVGLDLGGASPGYDVFNVQAINFAQVSGSAVPEPGTFVTLTLGLCGLGLARRRSRSGGVAGPAEPGAAPDPAG